MESLGLAPVEMLGLGKEALIGSEKEAGCYHCLGVDEAPGGQAEGLKAKAMVFHKETTLQGYPPDVLDHPSFA